MAASTRASGWKYKDHGNDRLVETVCGKIGESSLEGVESENCILRNFFHTARAVTVINFFLHNFCRIWW